MNLETAFPSRNLAKGLGSRREGCVGELDVDRDLVKGTTVDGFRGEMAVEGPKGETAVEGPEEEMDTEGPERGARGTQGRSNRERSGCEGQYTGIKMTNRTSSQERYSGSYKL